MLQFSLMLLAALAAVVIPVQAKVNAGLGQSLQHPFLAALISFLGGTLALLLITAVWSRGWPRPVHGYPREWYLYTGGLLGVIYVVAVLMLVPKIGTANVLAAGVFGQMVTSLIVDHYGLLGMTRSPISTAKVVGVLLLVLGTILIKGTPGAGAARGPGVQEPVVVDRTNG